MYNLLITSQKGAWDKEFYEYDRSRFLEYTNDQLHTKFKDLTDQNISTLKSIPCIFAYEGTRENIKIGRLTSIETNGRGRTIRIKYEFENIHEIKFSDIEPFTAELDIREWEMSRTHWAVKNEPLLEHLKKAAICEIENLAALDGIHTAIKTKKQSNEHKVTTVRGFIDKVLSLKGSSDNEVFYRGHSDKDYKLVPTLFRTDTQGNYLYLDKEHILYRELIISNSLDFAQDNGTLDRLVRMQHYSLPTRLLDITSNPLIALYFACISKPEKQGEVISFSLEAEKIKYFDSDTASCIANLARLPFKDRKDLTLGALWYDDEDIDGFNNRADIKKLTHFICEEKPFFESRIIPSDLQKIICIKGKRSNNRITSQSGAFLLFGINSVLNEEGNSDIEVNRLLINDKEKILRELDLLNINESTVFPYIENSAKYIAKKYMFKL